MHTYVDMVGNFFKDIGLIIQKRKIYREPREGQGGEGWKRRKTGGKNEWRNG